MDNIEHKKNQHQKKTVLIVDEDRKIVDLLSACFRSIGLDVSTADNAIEAVAILDSDHPDLLVLDIDVPSADGNSFLQLLDSQGPEWHVPSIVLSKSIDLNSLYRSQNVCAYYVHKSPQAWRKIEIFANELVDLGLAPIDESYNENNHQSDLL